MPKHEILLSVGNRAHIAYAWASIIGWTGGHGGRNVFCPPYFLVEQILITL